MHNSSAGKLVASVGVALALWLGAVRPFAPPNELVGQRACTHLMMRLVDCLVDACDIQLAVLADTTRPIGAPPGAIGALGPGARPRQWGEQRAPSNQWMSETFGELATNDANDQDEPPPSTTPMDWPTGSSTQAPPEVDKDEQPDTSECWRQALEWLRGRLLAIKMRLLISNPAGAGLADALTNFGQLTGHLGDVCPAVAPPPSQSSLDDDHRQALAAQQQQRQNTLALDFIIDAIRVLGEIEADSVRRQQHSQPGASIKLNGSSATEAIKRNYAYLTQIVTSYNLIFNQAENLI